MISGSIPHTIGNATNLEEVILSRNRFNGSIPSSIWKLDLLKHLHLDENQLTGSIHVAKSNRAKTGRNTTRDAKDDNHKRIRYGLKSFVLKQNLLVGSIPDSIVNLGRIGNIDLSNNRITGTIPSTIGDIRRLESLDLSSMELTGTVPSNIANMQRLQH